MTCGRQGTTFSINHAIHWEISVGDRRVAVVAQLAPWCDPKSGRSNA
jgi:hypothetical protein